MQLLRKRPVVTLLVFQGLELEFLEIHLETPCILGGNFEIKHLFCCR